MTEQWVETLRQAVEQRQAENFELHRRYINPGFVELLGMAGYGRRFVRARGLELTGEDGRQYLDFLSGFGVLNLGHNHPQVKAALRAVLDLDLPAFTQIECDLLEGLAAERLASLLPTELCRVFFCSSGSEAIEAALKLARAATGRRRLVGCDGGFHGHSMGALSLNGKASLRKRFAPLVPNVEHVPYDDIGALAKALRKSDVAGVLLEPIQGEGGTVVPGEAYLREAYRLCAQHGTLLIVDEVQTGLGRTGRMLALEHWRVVPDVVVLAKALGGGLMPVGAMVSRSHCFDRAFGSPQHCNDHETTFGGGPLAMAAVIATLDVLQQEGLIEHAARQGAQLRQRLEELAARFESIREIRGKGLMLGIKFEDITRGRLERTLLQKLGQASSYLLVQSIALRLIEKHAIIVQAAVQEPGVLKVMPPLAVTDAAIDRFIQGLTAVLDDTGHASAVAHLTKEALKRWF